MSIPADARVTRRQRVACAVSRPPEGANLPAHLRIVADDERQQRDPISGSTSHAAWRVMRAEIADPRARHVALVLAVTHAGDAAVTVHERRLAEQTGMPLADVEAALTSLEGSGHLTGVRGSQTLRA